MKRYAVLLGLLILFSLQTSLTHATMRRPVRTPQALQRTQSQAIQRAIRKNIQMIFKPRLVIAKGATGPVSSLALSRDESTLMTSVGDNSIRLWDLEIGREIAKLAGHNSRITALCISADGNTGASVSKDGQIGLWDLKNLKLSRTMACPSKDVKGLYFTSKGDRLITGSAGGKVHVWDVSNGQVLQAFAPQSRGMDVFHVSPKDDSLFTGGAKGHLSRHDSADGSLIQEFEGKDLGLSALGLDRQDKYLAGGSADGTVYVWDTASGKMLWEKKEHKGAVRSVAVNGEAGILVSGGKDQKVQLWDLKEGKLLKVLGTHEGPVNFVQVDEEGAYVLSASEDGMTRLWHAASGNLLVSMISTETGWAVVDTKGRFDGNESSLAGIEWQDENMQIPIGNFTQAYYEPALLARSKTDPDSLADVQEISAGVRYPPAVEIVPPDETKGKVRGLVKVRVKADDLGGGIEQVRLYRNGKAVGEKELTDTKKVKNEDGTVSVIQEYNVKLAPGDNLLSAVAVNEEKLESLPSSLTVSGAGEIKRSRLWLVAVGINEYQNKELNLEYAENDATAVRNFFISTDQPLPFVCEKPLFLRNQEATKENILKAVQGLQQVPPQDIALIYLAGHGVSYQNEWYFIPYELERPDQPDALAQKGLSSREMKRAIEAVSANRVFLVIDACHSGTAVSPIKKFTGMKALRMLARTVGLHILSATDRNQFSVELHTLGHGVFTYSLLNALKGNADGRPKDSVVSVRETMGYVETQVPVLSKRHANYTQFPTAHSRGIDFGVSKTE